MSDKIQNFIRQMAQENPNWGAPRNHKELLLLSFEVSERSISRYLKRSRCYNGAKQLWRTFHQNYRETINALDFYRVAA